MHRNGTFDQVYARVMVALCGYGHLMLEHSFHHANVGDLVIGGTPRVGENVYEFFLRDGVQGYRNAAGVETRRLEKSKRSVWHNHIVQNYLLYAVFLLGFTLAWGPAAGAIFIFQGVFSIFAVQVITFVQHYGLERRHNEPLAGHHSWADNCVIANALTFNNNHHGEHHLKPRIPYYHLRTHPNSPRLPGSYMMMFLLALVPLYWRVIMDKRLASHLLRLDGPVSINPVS